MDYLTLRRGEDVAAVIEVKKSRFIGVLRRVESEEQARTFVTERRREHHAARHHCLAFVVGGDSALQRSSDDGEPAGTAGIPMLKVLGGHGLSDVAAVVTRYFGGTLLGAGGLARAYSGAVTAAVSQATLVRRRRLALVTLLVSHDQVGRVESMLRGHGVTVRAVTYGDRAALTLATADVDSLTDLVAQVTSAEPELAPAGQEWVDLPT